MTLLPLPEAAAHCRVSRSTFLRRIAPNVPRVVVGTCVRYDAEDLDKWLASQKVGGSSGGEGSPESASASTGSGKKSRRVREIRSWLRKGRRACTPRLFLVDGGE